MKRERDQARMSVLRADLRDKQATLIAIAEPMRPHLTHDMARIMDDWIAALDIEPGQPAPIVDEWLRGTGRGGPDEGWTTTDRDLADSLEAHRVAAIMDDWHADNPGWWEAAG